MFTFRVRIRFASCDPGGVLYFAEVFDLAHQTYESFINEAQFEQDYFSSLELAIPIVNAEAKFFSPIGLHDDIDIVLTISEIKTTSFAINYRFKDKKGKEKASVRTVHVCISKGSGKKIPIPGELAVYVKSFSA